jgi:SAM-dependent methyltransferase
MNLGCPVCDSTAPLLDVVDFNKSCEEIRGKYAPLSGQPIYYAQCGTCGFSFSPTMYGWTLEEFASRVYNDAYIEFDPDYVTIRPSANTDTLLAMVRKLPDGFRHLDYGGGDGLLSALLRDSGWDSHSFDPFVDGPLEADKLGTFDLVTAFEVFEHVPDVQALMKDLKALLKTSGVVLFSTMLNDGHLRAGERIQWWYASPRNGHISLFSRDSLGRLGTAHSLTLASFTEGFHAFWYKLPEWAAHWLRP